MKASLFCAVLVLEISSSSIYGQTPASTEAGDVAGRRITLARAALGRWVISPAVACLSGLKSAPRKRVRGNPPRVQIPPPPPTD